MKKMKYNIFINNINQNSTSIFNFGNNSSYNYNYTQKLGDGYFSETITGNIDDFRIYNKVLSPFEIQTLYYNKFEYK